MAPDERGGDGKAPGALRTIGEVGAALGLKPHILRYWEERFDTLAPVKRSGGRRLYRPEDVRLIARIDRLVNHEGYTLKGAATVLKGESDDAGDDQAPSDLLPRLIAIRERLSAALR